MNSEKAHSELEKINRQRNLIGVGGYRNSKRDKNERHEIFSKDMRESEAAIDKMKLKGDV